MSAVVLIVALVIAVGLAVALLAGARRGGFLHPRTHLPGDDRRYRSHAEASRRADHARR